MDRLCRQGDGLFPVPGDIRFDCSCPDGAYMCKPVAAVLYGVGARLDRMPQLLFTLRQVDAAELLSKAGTGVVTAPVAGERTLAGDDVAALFGLEMDESTAAVAAAAMQPRAATKPAPVKRVPDPASRLLAALLRAGSLDNAAARAVTGLDAQAVRPLLKTLVADEYARVQGQGRGTSYVAVKKRLKT